MIPAVTLHDFDDEPASGIHRTASFRPDSCSDLEHALLRACRDESRDDAPPRSTTFELRLVRRRSLTA